MIQPGIAAERFAAACILGAVLGLWYEFLRPLRPRFTVAADLLFLAGTLGIWLHLSFGICGGDLRLGYSAGLPLGGVLASRLMKGLLGPVFSGFWHMLGRFFRFFCLPVKKILKFAKKLFASAKKWVTIKCNNRRQSRRVSGGPHHGKRKDPSAQYADHIPEKQPGNEDRGDLRYRVVYRGNDHPAPEPERH